MKNDIVGNILPMRRNKEGAWQVGVRRAEAEDFASDYPKLSGNRRAGGQQDYFQVHRLKPKFCYNPK